jgi:methionine-rich copper-binding protein CopC
VAINVRAANDPPVASDDTLSPNPQVIPFAQLLANDVAGPANEAGQTLTVTAVKDGAGGTVKASDTGVVFTPAAGYRGRAEFIYEVQDNGSTNGEADPRTATAQVRFDVTPGNPAPQPTIPPVVKRVSLVSGKVVVVFSQAIDPHALTVRIATPKGRTVSATMRHDAARQRIVLTPRHPLAAGRYVVTIRGAVTGKWSFTVRR